jgi:dimethylglycine dehydrogenase
VERSNSTPYAPTDGSVQIDNITPQYGTLVLAGPRSRDVLSRITDAALDNNNFPWLAARNIPINFTQVLALRINYVGELGWELHIPLEYQVAIYDELMAAGDQDGISDFGLYALDSLRLEKCYRAWKADLIDELTPFEASLERFVRLDKGDFIGRAALLEQQQKKTIGQRLVPLLVDSQNTDAPFCSSVFRDGINVGLTGSSGYGYTLGKSIALAYLRSDLTVPGTELEVDIFGDRFAAVVGSEPLYDPHNQRLRA